MSHHNDLTILSLFNKKKNKGIANEQQIWIALGVLLYTETANTMRGMLGESLQNNLGPEQKNSGPWGPWPHGGPLSPQIVFATPGTIFVIFY